MDAYSILNHLPEITDVVDGGQDTFLMMTNNTTHDVMMLQEPDYIPAQYVDNAEFESQNSERFTLEGNTLEMNEEYHYAHYQCNMAAMLQLGKWFDYMRENGVYDNTRIILVADHGCSLGQTEAFILEDGKDVSDFYPLLMVKDFDSKGFTTSKEFMTNGDVPTLAVKDIIKDPVNPFTGEKIDCYEKSAHAQYIIDSDENDIKKNNGNTFLPARWYSVHDNIWDKDNWEMVAEEAVFPMGE